MSKFKRIEKTIEKYNKQLTELVKNTLVVDYDKSEISCNFSQDVSTNDICIKLKNCHVRIASLYKGFCRESNGDFYDHPIDIQIYGGELDENSNIVDMVDIGKFITSISQLDNPDFVAKVKEMYKEIITESDKNRKEITDLIRKVQNDNLISPEALKELIERVGWSV